MRNYYSDDTHDPSSESFVARPHKVRPVVSDNENINVLNAKIAELEAKLYDPGYERHGPETTEDDVAQESPTAKSEPRETILLPAPASGAKGKKKKQTRNGSRK